MLLSLLLLLTNIYALDCISFPIIIAINVIRQISVVFFVDFVWLCRSVFGHLFIFISIRFCFIHQFYIVANLHFAFSRRKQMLNIFTKPFFD